MMDRPQGQRVGRRDNRRGGRFRLGHRAGKWEPVFSKSEATTKVRSMPADSEFALDVSASPSRKVRDWLMGRT
jgi:hypothetical protein